MTKHEGDVYYCPQTNLFFQCRQYDQYGICKLGGYSEFYEDTITTTRTQPGRSVKYVDSCIKVGDIKNFKHAAYNGFGYRVIERKQDSEVDDTKYLVGDKVAYVFGNHLRHGEVVEAICGMYNVRHISADGRYTHVHESDILGLDLARGEEVEVRDSPSSDWIRTEFLFYSPGRRCQVYTSKGPYEEVRPVKKSSIQVLRDGEDVTDQVAKQVKALQEILSNG